MNVCNFEIKHTLNKMVERNKSDCDKRKVRISEPLTIEYINLVLLK